MKQSKYEQHTVGTVFLIGAGPGDPGLLTRAGAQALSRADAVVFDRLANPALLKLAPPSAELIDVGKSPSQHKYTQNGINSILVELALQGKTVCRLKGGDSFVFGRGGEEATVLKESHIPFVVIPGVTSAIAVPAYAGIPVTDRRFARSFAVVTGHDGATDEKGGEYETPNADTIIYLMGLANLSLIVEQLLATGRNSATPVAVIQEGTTPRQCTVIGTLATIVEQVQTAGLHSPVITVVGEVVNLHESLAWFDQQPLFGKRILVTRATGQADALAALITDAGAEPVVIPLIAIEQLPTPDNLLSRLQQSDWLIFTSSNGVISLVQQLESIGCDLRSMGTAKIAAIGHGTALTLNDLNLHVDFIPTHSDTATLALELPDPQRVSVISPLEGRESLPRLLRERGAQIDVIPVYQTVPVQPVELPDLPTIDVITFASPSAVRAFCDIAGTEISNSLIACLGSSTTTTAMEAGLPVHVESAEMSMTALVDALKQYYVKDLTPDE